MDELVTDIINLNQVRTPLEERIRIYSKFAAQVQRALLGLFKVAINKYLLL